MEPGQSFKIRYIPPGIVRVGEDDFCLEYEANGFRLLLNGVLKSSNSEGFLYFPSERKWDEHFPSLNGERERVKANIIEYANTSFEVKFVADFLNDEERIIAVENSLLEKRAKETALDEERYRAFLVETETAKALLNRLRSQPKKLPVYQRVRNSAIRILLFVLLVFGVLFVIDTIKYAQP